MPPRNMLLQWLISIGCYCNNLPVHFLHGWMILIWFRLNPIDVLQCHVHPLMHPWRLYWIARITFSRIEWRHGRIEQATRCAHTVPAICIWICVSIRCPQPRPATIACARRTKRCLREWLVRLLCGAEGSGRVAAYLIYPFCKHVLHTPRMSHQQYAPQQR